MVQDNIYGQSKAPVGLAIKTEGAQQSITNGLGMLVTPISPYCSQQKMPFPSAYSQDQNYILSSEFNQGDEDQEDDISTLIAKHYQEYDKEQEQRLKQQLEQQTTSPPCEKINIDPNHESFFDTHKEYQNQPQFTMQLNNEPAEQMITNDTYEWNQYPFTLELNDIENDRATQQPFEDLDSTSKKKLLAKRRHSVLSHEVHGRDSGSRSSDNIMTPANLNGQFHNPSIHSSYPSIGMPNSPYNSADAFRAHTTSPEFNGRNKRNTYSRRRQLTNDEVNVLTNVFQHCDKPNALLREQLADQMGMTARAVQIWFQNKRAKRKKDLATKGASELTSPNMSASSHETGSRYEKGKQQAGSEDSTVLQRLVEQLGEVSKRHSMSETASGIILRSIEKQRM